MTHAASSDTLPTRTPPPAKILVIEDDPAIRVGLELNLRHEGYRTLCAATGEEGIALAQREKPDVVILDLMLPGCSGHDVLRELRRNPDTTQVLILSALDRTEDVIEGLKLGADDYIRKPFAVAELLARIEAALRRKNALTASLRSTEHDDAKETRELNLGDVTINLSRRAVGRAGVAIKLTAREFDLLVLLVENPERVFSRDQLLTRIWGSDYEGTTRTVDNFMRALRRKLEATPQQPRHLQTVHGIGYRFVP